MKTELSSTLGKADRKVFNLCIGHFNTTHKIAWFFFSLECYNNKWKSKGGTHCDHLDSEIIFGDSGELSDHGTFSTPDGKKFWNSSFWGCHME